MIRQRGTSDVARFESVTAFRRSERAHHPDFTARASVVVELDRAPVALEAQPRERGEAAELQLTERRPQRKARVTIRSHVGEQKQSLVGAKPSDVGLGSERHPPDLVPPDQP